MSILTTLVQDKNQPPTIQVCGAFAGAADPNITPTPTAADATAVAGDYLAVDATAAAVAITLPATPNDCDKVALQLTNTANVITADPGANNIAGTAGVSTLTNTYSQGDILRFKYDSANTNWVITKV